MGDILLVSKPVVPPWNDSSKNLVRDLARHLSGHQARVLVARGTRDLDLGSAIREPVYGSRRAGFSPALAANARVFLRLLLGTRPDIYHFFFAPNARSAAAARLCMRVRRQPSVQTVCSAPAETGKLSQMLFADRIVVLSEHTRERFLGAGVAPERLLQIPPCVEPLTIPTEPALAAVQARHRLPADVPLLLYPGDLEFSAGADRSLEVLADNPRGDAHLVIASRPKTPRARVRERHLKERAAAMGLAPRVHFLGEIEDMHGLLRLATVILLLAETLYAKMDLPLVLLEAMSLERPVVVVEGTAAAELARQGAAISVPPDRDAIASAVGELLDDPSRCVDLGLQGRAQVARDHAPGMMADRYRVLYDQLL